MGGVVPQAGETGAAWGTATPVPGDDIVQSAPSFRRAPVDVIQYDEPPCDCALFYPRNGGTGHADIQIRPQFIFQQTEQGHGSVKAGANSVASIAKKLISGNEFPLWDAGPVYQGVRCTGPATQKSERACRMTSTIREK
ncbi:hypothetical protein [Paraburkholderia gardini]|uniref:hypothetical protein n=1 Tax=Paraburkholderia gardini TaxID=2823469 RepID=UPI001E62072C|nr:hypothetical protein [Paraburkholderia gardini]